jgi:transcriptional regulator with XRE-family HTH domain
MEELGTLLRQWRAERRLSLSALAVRAGVSKGTLSGWETGAHQPCMPEFLAVLGALGASHDQRVRALVHVDAPRARQALSAALGTILGVKSAAIPVPGRLLRALRCRRRLSLSQVARVIGVRPSTISRWERSESAPSSERLEALLDLLGARREERAALVSGQALRSLLSFEEPAAPDDLARHLEEIRCRVLAGRRALVDLEFLSWEIALWPLAARSAAARELLMRGWSEYARWLSWEDRRREASIYAERVLDRVRAAGRVPSGSLVTVWGSVHVSGLVMGRSGTRGAPGRAVEWLQSWLDVTRGTPCEVALYRDVSDHLNRDGRREAALACALQAYGMAEQLEDPDALRLCRSVHASVLLSAGEARKVLPLLIPPDEHSHPVNQILEALQWARALLAVGEREAAIQRLREAYRIIDRYDYPSFRPTVDGLAWECLE